MIVEEIRVQIDEIEYTVIDKYQILHRNNGNDGNRHLVSVEVVDHVDYADPFESSVQS